nr:NTP transferase domain-containing protein [Terrimesophilobacter mesophilus]
MIDAIVLSGGRSARLDSVPKSEFTVDGVTLLERTIAAIEGARHIVVVGPQPGRPLPDSVLLAREDPPYSGPVAAIAAGLDALREGFLSPTGRAGDVAEPSEATLVLACDMPQVHLAVGALEQALAAHPDADGVIAVDSGDREQPLAACYRTHAIAEAVARRRAAGPLDSMRVFELIEDLDLRPVIVPAGTTSDVDSWADAARLSALPPTNR